MNQGSIGRNAVITRLESVLGTTARFRLPNPYHPESNNENFLVNGYAVAMDQAQNTDRLVNGFASVKRVLKVVLTRQYFAKESDFAAKAAAEDQLFDDQAALINDFEQDPSLNGQVMYTRYESDGGIETVESGTGRFIMLRSDFSVEYLQKFT